MNEQEINQKTGEILRSVRRIKGISQQALGRALGITFQQVQKMERGQNRISVGRLVQISHFLQVPISVFFNFSKWDGKIFSAEQMSLIKEVGSISRRWNEAFKDK